MCLGDAPAFVQDRFKHYSSEHLEWRWNQLVEVLDSLDDRTEYLFRYYDSHKMAGHTSFKDDDTPAGASRKKVVEKMDKVLKDLTC